MTGSLLPNLGGPTCWGSTADMRDRRTLSVLGLMLALAVASVFCVSLVEFRTRYRHDSFYRFLDWNLFLAWVPVGVRCFRPTGVRVAGLGCIATALGVLWLLFFPNAPYMLTDFIHLHESPTTPLWYDGLMLSAFAWTALLLGFFSLYLMQTLSRQLGRVSLELGRRRCRSRARKPRRLRRSLHRVQQLGRLAAPVQGRPRDRHSSSRIRFVIHASSRSLVGAHELLDRRLRRLLQPCRADGLRATANNHRHQPLAHCPSAAETGVYLRPEPSEGRIVSNRESTPRERSIGEDARSEPEAGGQLEPVQGFDGRKFSELSPRQIRALQVTAGNTAVSRLLERRQPPPEPDHETVGARGGSCDARRRAGSNRSQLGQLGPQSSQRSTSSQHFPAIEAQPRSGRRATRTILGPSGAER